MQHYQSSEPLSTTGGVAMKGDENFLQILEIGLFGLAFSEMNIEVCETAYRHS